MFISSHVCRWNHLKTINKTKRKDTKGIEETLAFPTDHQLPIVRPPHVAQTNTDTVSQCGYPGPAFGRDSKFKLHPFVHCTFLDFPFLYLERNNQFS
jgi:hypothetical protein